MKPIQLFMKPIQLFMKPIAPWSAAFAALLFYQPIKAEKLQNPVNIILIYLDDMGYGDLSLTGARGYSTPNIDRMPNDGVFFSHYY